MPEALASPKSETSFFNVLVEGKFNPEKISVELVNGTRESSEESQVYIDSEWKSFPGKKWPNDTEPSRYRFEEVVEKNGQIILRLDPSVSYKDSLGTRSSEFREKFGEEYQARDIATSILVQTSDNMLILTRRNETHDYKPNGLHVSAGGFVTFKDEQNGNLNPLTPVYRELHEEVGLEKEELLGVTFLGIVDNPHESHPDLIFEAKTHLSSEQIVDRERDEENEVIFINDKAAEVKDWILGLSHSYVTVGAALLILHGKERFGDHWYEEVIVGLKLRGKDYHDRHVYDALEARDKLRLSRRLGESPAKRKKIIEASKIRKSSKSALSSYASKHTKDG